MTTLFGRRRAVLIGGAGLLGACSPGANTGTLPIILPDPLLGPWERAMFLRVNRDRGEHSLPPLSYLERLAEVARYHADDMARHRFFAHDSPTSGSLDDRLARANVLVAVGRENLAEADTVEHAEDGLLKSPGHFANLMATDVTHIGIGIVRGGLVSPLNRLFVQVFARPVRAESPSEARSTVIEVIARGRSARGLPKAVIDSKLDEIAASEISALDDDVGQAALGEIGKRALSKSKSLGGAILCTGQRVVAASEYTPPEAVTSMKTVRVGVAAAPARDERGHPGVKILVLIAYR